MILAVIVIAGLRAVIVLVMAGRFCAGLYVSFGGEIVGWLGFIRVL